jgi:hypothetical protein
MVEYSSCKFDPPCLFKIWIHLRLYILALTCYFRHAITIGVVNVHIMNRHSWSGDVSTFARCSFCFFWGGGGGRGPEKKVLSYWQRLLLSYCMYLIIFTSSIGGADKKGKPCKKFAMLCLFIETMPIYKAIATGNRKNEFKLQITFNCHNARQNLNYCVLPQPPHFSLPERNRDYKNKKKSGYSIKRGCTSSFLRTYANRIFWKKKRWYTS